MSRKRSQPPISLFSFQDIITAVTAIVIVIVICLTLELLDRSTRPTESHTTAAIKELRAAVDELRSQWTALDSEAARNTVLLAEAASVTPSSIASQISELERLLIDAESALSREKIRAEQLQQESARVDAERFNSRAQLKDLEQLDERITEIKSRFQNLKETERPIYSMPRGSTREGWLVVVSADQIQTARIGVRSPPVIFQQSSAIRERSPSAASQCLEWIDAQQSNNRYFIVIARPGGADLFERLEEGLRSRQLSFGFDVTGINQPLLDPIAGAGTP